MSVRRWLSHGIGRRIFAGFALVAVLTSLVAIGSIIYIRGVSENLTRTSERLRLLQADAMQLRLTVEQESDNVRGYLLTGDESFLVDRATATSSYTATLVELKKLSTASDAQLLSEMDSLHSEFLSIAQEQTNLRDQGFPATAVFLWQVQGNQVGDMLDSRLSSLIALRDQDISTYTRLARQAESRAVLVAIGIVGLMWVLAIVVGIITTRGITRPIRALVSATDGIRKGDLSARAPSLGEDEIGTLGAAFNRMAQSIEESREQTAELAAIQERQRLARDLHDAVTQTLFSASIVADVLPRIWKKDPAEGERRMEELRKLARGALAEMRMLLLELRPSALAEVGLGRLLNHLADAASGRSNLKVSLSIEEECSIPHGVQMTFYRVAQEAINNIVKHAAATEVAIGLKCRENSARLVVSDNGSGFSPSAVTSDHMGLKIMRERAEASGADLAIESSSGRGTVVTLLWPRATAP